MARDPFTETAGATCDPQTEDHDACIAELRPAIKRLLAQGRPPGAIIATLARLTVETLNGRH